MAENTTIGVENLTAATNESTHLTINETASTIGGTVAGTGIGSRPLTGLVLLAGTTYILYDFDASVDQGASLLVPLLFILGRYGFLPYGQGIEYGALVAIAGIISYGITRWML